MSKENIKPLADFILIEPDKVEETESGILLISNERKRKETGTVLAVGVGGRDANGKLVSMSLKVKDKVIFNKNVAIKFDHKGQELCIIREIEIWGKIE